VVGEDGGSRGRGWWGEKGVKLRLERSEGGERRGKKRCERGGGMGGGLLRRLRSEEERGKSQRAEAMDVRKPRTKKRTEDSPPPTRPEDHQLEGRDCSRVRGRRREVGRDR